MAKKTNRNDQPPAKASPSRPVLEDNGRQPRIVGWLVLIVGGFSSWYWYRPLPDSVHQTVHATGPSSWASSKSGPNSLWTDQTLILPSTEEKIDAASLPLIESSSQANDDSQLVGSPKVTLVPWNDVHVNIRDVIKTERVPLVPVTPDFQKETLADAPQPWTPDQQLSNRAGAATEFKPKWPDAGYIPQQKLQKEQRRAATQITTPIPKLLETGMKSIRPDETENLPQSNVSAQPPRQPQFIRQPRSSN